MLKLGVNVQKSLRTTDVDKQSISFTLPMRFLKSETETLTSFYDSSVPVIRRSNIKKYLEK